MKPPCPESEEIQFVRLDDSTELLETSYRLRYQVYGLEKGFFKPDHRVDSRDQDDYDQWSLHFGAIDSNGNMVGTIRMVIPPAGQFPLLDHCTLDCKNILTQFKTAEISRLAISKSYLLKKQVKLFGIRVRREKESLLLRKKLVMGLYRAVYRESKRQGVEYWVAAMERSLQRLLSRHSFCFRPVGPEVDYYGPVTPYLASVDEMESAVRSHRPSLFEAFQLSRYRDPTKG